MQANQDIRKAIKDSKHYAYEVAEIIGVSEFTLTRWLRRELSADKKAAIIAAVKELTENGGDAV